MTTRFKTTLAAGIAVLTLAAGAPLLMAEAAGRINSRSSDRAADLAAPAVRVCVDRAGLADRWASAMASAIST